MAKSHRRNLRLKTTDFEVVIEHASYFRRSVIKDIEKVLNSDHLSKSEIMWRVFSRIKDLDPNVGVRVQRSKYIIISPPFVTMEINYDDSEDFIPIRDGSGSQSSFTFDDS